MHTANCLQHVRSSAPGANHVQIACNTSSTYHMQHVVCYVVWKDSSAIKFDRVYITSSLALAESLTDED